MGSGQTITWSFSGLGEDQFVRIFLYKGGSYVGEIFGNVVKIPIGSDGIGSKYWGIPLSEPTLPAGDDYRIYIEYVCNPYPCSPPSNLSGLFRLNYSSSPHNYDHITEWRGDLATRYYSNDHVELHG